MPRGFRQLWLGMIALLSLTWPLRSAEPDATATLQQLLERLDALERDNQQLRERLESLEENRRPPDRIPPPASLPPPSERRPRSESEVNEWIQDAVKSHFEDEKKRQTEAEEQKKAQDKVVGRDTALSGAWNNGAQFKSSDGVFQFHLGGRVDFDNTWFRQDANLLFGNDNTTSLEDGSDFRRLRLRVDGSFWENIDFVFEVNFANIQDFSNVNQDIRIGSVGLTDVNLTFREIPLVGNVRVGHFNPPISLEHVTSSTNWRYMERSPYFDAFINRFDYVNGIMFFDTIRDEQGTLALAFIRTGSRNVNPFGAGAGDGQYGLSARATYLPVDHDDGRELVHLGLGYLQRVLDDKTTSPGARASVRGGGASDIPNVIAAGNIFGPQGQYYISPEFAWVHGPFSISSEYLLVYLPASFLQRSPAGVYTEPRGPLVYHGFYVESGLFITPGDYRRYNRKVGCWDRVVPVQNGYLLRRGHGRPIIGRGAIELLARFAYLDLESGNPVVTPAQGARAGESSDFTLGVNWYLNPQARVMVNYVRTYIASVEPGASGQFDGLGLRFHYDF